ncbi:MAG: type II toxin-antitoxin system HicA family toxin [Planctomycetaceae bacterium]|nr:type II toxin-antitoxin system HicA family toxin [Planctomycetaceae bacterium]
MNSKHRKTLATIRANPKPKTLPFRDVESLLKAMGCQIVEGDGSRVTFVHPKGKWDTHRPHPGKELLDYKISSLRQYLEIIEFKEAKK